MVPETLMDLDVVAFAISTMLGQESAITRYLETFSPMSGPSSQ